MPIRNREEWLSDAGDIVLQEVLLTGPEGENWVAAYFAARQPGGTWRITGYSFAADPTP